MNRDFAIRAAPETWPTHGSPASGGELSVNAVAFLPSNPEHLVVCNRSPQIFVMSLSGAVVQTLASGKREGGDFVACAVSAKGQWVHAVAEDGQLYCFDLAEGTLQHLLRAHDKDKIIGVAIHPHRNLVATWADEDMLRLWRR